MKNLFLGLSLSLCSLNAFSNPSNPDNERYYQHCVQECVSFYDNSGHALRSCLNECGRRYPFIVEEPKKPQWCETYEDDCSRPPNEF